MKENKNIFERTVISKLLKRSSKIGIAGRFVCNKNKHPLFYQSYLELGALRLLALDKSVKFMDSQQGTGKWQPTVSKSLRTYTPDIITLRDTGEISFYEVKPQFRLTKAERSRLNEIKMAYESAGYCFDIITDRDVTYETFVNTGHILCADVSQFESSFLDVVADSISTTLSNRFSYSEFDQALRSFGFPICPFGMIKAGLFSIDLKELISPASLVWRAE